MKNRAIRNIAILGSLAIAGVISVQIYWINQALNLQQQKFQENVFISLKKVAENISEYNQMDIPVVNPVKQISSDYYIVNIREAIDANILDLYLRTEFIKRNIQTDYEYAIYDCASEKMVYGAYVSFKNKIDKKEIEELPKYEDFIYYFGVNFPSKTSYLMAGNKLWIFFSFILLLTVLFFVYALNIILRQKRLSELQKDFINNMTHEFKTPISTINIAAEALLKESIISEKSNLTNYTQIINEQNQRLNKQVEKILQIAEIDRQEIKLNFEKTRLNDAIHSMVKSVELSLKKKGGEISTELNAVNDFITCDKIHLTNILYNIIDNAIKYNRKKPNIKIETLEVERFLYIKIKDNGIGIPKEKTQKVKGKFFRIPTGRVHNVKGLGLGLYYVDQICKAHNWKWKIESTINQGTTVLFKIRQANG